MTTHSAENIEHHHGGGTKLFLYVWFGLLGLTVIEVVLAYVQLALTLMLIVLMGLSIMKAALIMAYFMHLRFERMRLVMTIIPAMIVCISLLFVFFPDSLRLMELRPK